MSGQTVTMLALSPDGVLTEVAADPAGVLSALYCAIGCRSVTVIRLPNGVDMWADDDALEEPVPNLYASAVMAALDPELMGQVVAGTVVFAGVRGADTVSLDDHSREFITSVVKTLASVIPPLDSLRGRAWGWEHEGVHFLAIAMTDSPQVQLVFRSPSSDAWTFSHVRGIGNSSAEAVAKDMYRDTTRDLT